MQKVFCGTLLRSTLFHSITVSVCLSGPLICPCLSACVSDFVLTYKYLVKTKKGKTEEEIKKSSENRKRKRDAFFSKLTARGFEFEEQDPKVMSHKCL